MKNHLLILSLFILLIACQHIPPNNGTSSFHCELIVDSLRICIDTILCEINGQVNSSSGTFKLSEMRVFYSDFTLKLENEEDSSYIQKKIYSPLYLEEDGHFTEWIRWCYLEEIIVELEQEKRCTLKLPEDFFTGLGEARNITIYVH